MITLTPISCFSASPSKRELRFQSTPCPSRLQDAHPHSGLHSAISHVTRTTTSSGGATELAIKGVGGKADEGKENQIQMHTGKLNLYTSKAYSHSNYKR